MFHKWLPRPVSLVLVILASFAVMSHSLTGCSGGTPMARVFNGFDVSFSKSYENTPEFQQFRQAYNELTSNNGTRAQQFKHFSDAYHRIRADYVHETQDGPLIAAALEGLKKIEARPGSVPPVQATEAALDSILESLDPHSSYLNPQEYQDSKVITHGEFGGLGIEVNMDKDRKVIRVISPISDTPAYRAGLKAGDLITHVDGDPILGMAFLDAVRRLRGRPRTDVRLTIERESQPRPFQVTITRDIIHIQPVKWATEGNIGIVRVTHFISSSAEALEDAMTAIRQKLGGRVDGIVLDLRNNPGGLLRQSVAVTDAFLQQGEIVSVRDRAGRANGYEADRGDLASGLPIVVLINRGSASASEIVAGALQDHQRAIIMGSRSFGKGSVQTISPLNWDGALRLTTALYYLPSGRTIQGQGVDPDIRVRSKEEPDGRRESDLPQAITGSGKADQRVHHSLEEDNCPTAGPDGKDKMLGCAVMLLRSTSKAEFLARIGAQRSL